MEALFVTSSPLPRESALSPAGRDPDTGMVREPHCRHRDWQDGQVASVPARAAREAAGALLDHGGHLPLVATPLAQLGSLLDVRRAVRDLDSEVVHRLPRAESSAEVWPCCNAED